MPSLNTGNAILSNAIAVDSSYNVGIGGAASGSYKLQVTGNVNADNFIIQPTGYGLLASLSRDLTGSGFGVLNLKNGSNGFIQPAALSVDRTYTLPDATGTIALTSNLSAYLPLTGGTLTGALSGTSATFSGNVNIQDSSLLNLGSNQGGGATLKYNSNGNLDITPRSGFNSVFTAGNVLIGTNSNSTGSPTFHIQNKSGLVASIAGFNFASTSTAENANNNILSTGAYYNGALVIATQTTAALYQQSSGGHTFYSNDGLTAGNSYSATERLTILSGGNVGIGTSSPSEKLHISSSASATEIRIENSTTSAYIRSQTDNLNFYFNGGERMRITSGGLFFVNTTTSAGYGNGHRIYRGVAQGDYFLSIDNGGEFSSLFMGVSGGGYSAGLAGQWVGKNTSTGRSINAGGTINASGADYAEYMTKAIEDNIAKGDIVGVDENGLLTNIYINAKSFVVKSTDPSYVGGDTWGSVDNIGKKIINGTDKEKELLNIKLQQARAKVDRIAFSGQVPCNVYDAQVGDYIIPIELDGKITGQAVTNPTFEQYQISVGKVWKIMEDGRAWIAVKIG